MRVLLATEPPTPDELELQFISCSGKLVLNQFVTKCVMTVKLSHTAVIRSIRIAPLAQ